MAKKSKETGMLKNNPSFFQRHFYVLTDLFDFVKGQKKWWLLPTIILLLLVGIAIIIAESSVLSPFIYALF